MQQKSYEFTMYIITNNGRKYWIGAIGCEETTNNR